MEIYSAASTISVCVINYNGEQYLKKTLNAISNIRQKFIEIILIDNNSNDKSLELVERQFQLVNIIKLSENKGPGAARNEGFKNARGQYILFVDNDVILTPACPDLLLKALLANPKAAAAMPTVFYDDNKNLIQYDGADCHYLGLMIIHNSNSPKNKNVAEIKKLNSIVTAVFLLDRRQWNENEEPFDLDFFYGLEDHDFGIRTRISGYEILSVPEAVTYHQEGTKGFSLRPGKAYPQRRVFFHIRNRWQILLKNYQIKTLILLSPILIIYELFQLGWVIKKGWLKMWFKAFLSIVLNFNKILYKRRLVQQGRKTPDRKILQNGSLPFTEISFNSEFEVKLKNILDYVFIAYWNKIKGIV